MTVSARNEAAFDVSVVIPLYDKRAFIPDTLRSASSQTLRPREILVIDDGSSDGGDRLVEEVGDPLVRLVRQANAGPGAARNRGVAEAHGEWIAFLDADDLWRDDHLAELARAHRSAPDAAMLSTSYEEFDGSETPPAATAHASSIRSFDLLAVPPIAKAVWTSAMAVRRDILLESGGFGPGRLAEDVDLWVRLGLDHVIAISPRATALYRRDTGGLTEQYLASATAAQPGFLDLLRNAANDPRHEHRRAAIHTYARRWHRLFARQAIAMGDRGSTRHHLQALAAYGDPALSLRILAALPVSLVTAARRARSRLNRRA